MNRTPFFLNFVPSLLLISLQVAAAFGADLPIPNEIPRKFPNAQIENGTVHYGSVRASDGTLRRVIVTQPNIPGPRPAVVFIGGVGCYSLDEYSFGTPASYIRIIKALNRAGLVTLRVEKSGIGDSQGNLCRRSSFRDELSHYVAATEYAAQLPFVDKERLILVGHSMGGVFAPIVATTHRIRAIFAIATLGQGWISYEQENFRRQLKLGGESDESIEKTLTLFKEFQNLFYVKKMPASTIKQTRPDLDGFSEFPAGDSFRQQLAGLDVLSVWKNVRSRVHLLRGVADFTTSSADHHRIVRSVRWSPAKFTEVPHLDHFFNEFDTEAESYAWASKSGFVRLNARFFDEFAELVRQASN